MKRRNILLLLALAVAVGAAFGLKEYMRGHADVADMDAAHTVSADALLAEFMGDEATATAKYVGEKEQAIAVSGLVRSIAKGSGDAVDNVVLETGDDMAGIICEFSKGAIPASWQEGLSVRVKGICQGYTGEGMIPGDVVLQRCAAME